MSVKKANLLDLALASHHCRLLSDSTRLRLLLLLEHEELSVAELSSITQLAQPRVSTHLAKLKEANLVADRREGVSVYYRLATVINDSSLEALWQVLRNSRSDPLAQQDLARAQNVLRSRRGNTWADSVAGDMERHYSPGRTWEATAHGLVHLLEPGDVLDIASGDGVLAELLAPRAKHITCLDISQKVVDAAKKRVMQFANVQVQLGDMHELPVADKSFDTVLLMHALTYTRAPQVVLQEATRVLRHGGKLLAVTLAQHQHAKAVEPYNHANLGFSSEQLQQLAIKAGLQVIACAISAVEKRTPNFAILSLSAVRG
jgi:ubiquinone/menaquinone biosynthesis C-methylase UbiE/DNA-binding transcriptional ArsR family regulator